MKRRGVYYKRSDQSQYDNMIVNTLKGRKKEVKNWKREDVITQKASPSVSLSIKCIRLRAGEISKISRGYSWNLRFGAVASVIFMPPRLGYFSSTDSKAMDDPCSSRGVVFAFRKTKNYI